MRFLICFFILLSLPAMAASAGTRSVRILYLGAPANAAQKLFLADGTGCQEVETPQMNLSPVYQLPAGPLVIHLLTAAPAKLDEINPAAPKATIAESVTDLYLLLSSDPTNTLTPVKMQIIDVNTTQFKNGQMLWFNLTKNDVGGILGNQKLALAANTKAVIDAPSNASGDYDVNLSFRIPGDERLFPLCETKWSHDPRSRTLFFILTEEGNRTPRVMGFPDYRDEKESALKP